MLISVYRRFATVGFAAVLALIGTSLAFAASPQVIYRDLADNGRLDGKYTPAEIERALPAVPPRAARKDDRRVPFSRLDVALLIAGGGPLLLIGAGLRRRLATAPVEPTVARG